MSKATASTHQAFSREGLGWVLLPLAAALLVYFNALAGEFVYDDNDQILKNAWVQDSRFLPDVLAHPVWAYQTAEPTNYYRPIQMGLYNLLWGAFGPNPLPFHLLNLLFHLINTTALFLLIRRLSGEAAVATGAALLFAVHPLNTEAVAWIACLPELTYAFFVLAALLCQIRSWSETGSRRLGLRGLAVLLFILGMFSKETALVLPILIVLAEIWLRPRLAGAPERAARRSEAIKSNRGRPHGKPHPWVSLGLEVLPFALAGLGYFAVRLEVIGGIAPRSRAGLTWLDALINAPILLLAYFRAMIAPVRLLAFHVTDYAHSFASPAFLASALGAAILAGGVLGLARRWPDLAFAGALALLPFLPVLYIPAVGENAFAERYAYLPTAGFLWLLAGAAVKILRRLGGGRRAWAALIGLMLLLALLGGAGTVVRNAVWHDDHELSTITLKDEPRAWRMYVLLANWYYRHDQFENALEAVDQGLTRFPEIAPLQVVGINTRILLHRIPPLEAVQALERIVALNPNYNEAQYSLGGAYLKANRPADAIAALEKVVSLDSMDKEALNRLGAAYAQAGRRPEARSAFQRALAIDPAFARARRNLDRLDGRLKPEPGD